MTLVNTGYLNLVTISPSSHPFFIHREVCLDLVRIVSRTLRWKSERNLHKTENISFSFIFSVGMYVYYFIHHSSFDEWRATTGILPFFLILSFSFFVLNSTFLFSCFDYIFWICLLLCDIIKFCTANKIFILIFNRNTSPYSNFLVCVFQNL